MQPLSFFVFPSPFLLISQCFSLTPSTKLSFARQTQSTLNPSFA
jgi:hypothetical protein